MSASSRPENTTLVHIRAPHGAQWFEMEWGDGWTTRLPNRILRGYCPCAGCQGHTGKIRFQSGVDTELRDIETVGNYGLRLSWGDGHGTGIHTFVYLRSLCRWYEEHGDALPEQLPELPSDA